MARKARSRSTARVRAGDGARGAGLGHGDVGKRAVRLHMREPVPGLRGEGGCGADLVGDEALDLGLAHHDAAAAEAGPVGEARMRADGDIARAGQREGRCHDVGVAGVEAAGDVGRGDDVEHRRVVAPIAQAPYPSPQSQLRSTTRIVSIAARARPSRGFAGACQKHTSAGSAAAASPAGCEGAPSRPPARRGSRRSRRRCGP